MPGGEAVVILVVGVWRLCTNLCGRRRARRDRAASERLLRMRVGGDGATIETYMLSMLPNEEIDKLLNG